MPGVLFRVQGNSVAVLCQVFCSGYKGIVLLSYVRCSVQGTRE